ncbi:endoplasmic reticulum-derived transport vesicle erv46 [Moniliophthora roreri]|uniref:Putative endoplasmic reticulum-derived transport vesicle ERV46 n=1 Tax=Moniliophthora roreri TaxID=221103 RepID=A0A0W0G9I0_MONRR|nr:endoplasmic reticulum-derived transport vesicle erv46 [Moniliophthora roreri]
MENDSSDSILDKLDTVVPAPLAQFDAFPKLPSTYKSRSESRGFMTLFVGLLALLLMLNDIGEFIWGWPDYEFSVDKDTSSFININLDVLVAMPCRYLSVDLRDAVGDRLMLSASPKHDGKGMMRLRRDGKKFDVGKATKLKEHAEMLSARQAVAQSRKSRGFFDTILGRGRSSAPQFKPTYEYETHGSGCRIYGSLEVKKVTANLHITTLGHGYASYEHVDHSQMNLSHVINEFSFGPYFPDITQPLDYSFEVTNEHFVAYQYFMHVVPTTYIAPRSAPLRTNQYSVTHYTRVLEHNKGTPGIFFKFDLDPMSLTIHQRTTSLIQLIIRCVGVIGGVFVCMGYAIRITTRAVEVVTGPDDSDTIAVAASGASTKAGLRSKWAGGHLRSRSKVIRQGSGWTVDNSNPGSPAMSTYSGYSSYAGSPMPGQQAFSPYPSQQVFSPVASPYLSSPAFATSNPTTPNPGSSFGPPPMRNSPSLGPPPMTRTSSGGSTGGGVGPGPGTGTQSHFGPTPGPTPNTASLYGHFPPTPNPAAGEGSGFPSAPPPRRTSSGGAKKED